MNLLDGVLIELDELHQQLLAVRYVDRMQALPRRFVRSLVRRPFIDAHDAHRHHDAVRLIELNV